MPAEPAQLFRAAAEDEQRPILAALRRWMPDKSWSQVRRLLHGRHVQIDGNVCLDEGRRLRGTEVVKVFHTPAAPPPQDDDVRVRFLDPHLVIVEKPAGMTTQRHHEERDWPKRRRQVQPTLDEVLPRIVAKKVAAREKSKGPAKKHGKAAPNNWLPVRAVHRLDRETSGLMVFARTVPCERALVELFSRHDIDRVYLALVPGRVGEQTFESHLARDRGDGKRGSTTDTESGKRAVTHVRPVEYLDGYTLLECRLETGRTHQIRIHLAEAGHPLCGDKVYRGGFRAKPLPDDSGARRVALHAAELGFTHPITGERLHFTMPLPDDFANLLQRLRKKTG